MLQVIVKDWQWTGLQLQLKGSFQLETIILFLMNVFETCVLILLGRSRSTQQSRQLIKGAVTGFYYILIVLFAH